jgi:hypothetical protein
MHFKALSILIALLYVNAFGALAAPLVYRRSPNPPAPTHFDQTKPHHVAAWSVGGAFHPLHATSIGHAHAQLTAANTQHKDNVRNWAAHGQGPKPQLARPEHFIGQGAQAQVFHSPHTVDGHHAVVKVFHPSHGVLDHHEFNKEIANSKQAGQYLGHGHHAPSNTHYLIQKNMGGPQPHGMSPEHVAGAQAEARNRYATEKHITHHDAHNPENYVYHPDPTAPGGHKAELIDWGNASIHPPPPKKGPFGLWRK